MKINFIKLSLSVLILPLLCIISCESDDDNFKPSDPFPKYSWVDAADSSSYSVINRYWNTQSHCFNNTFEGEIARYDYWPEAHGLDLLIDTYIRTGDEKISGIIYDFYEGVRKKNWYSNNWSNEYYDDMGWHCMAHMRAYAATNDSRYKESSRNLWEWITEGWSDYDGGGIQWRKGTDETSMGKGLPSNGPAAIIAARRAQLYPDESIGGFTNTEWAHRIYDWIKDNRFVRSTGRVWEIYTQTNNDYSYDVGTFIGAALEMYALTGDKVYLNDAVKAANYHMGHNVNTNYMVMYDYGEQHGNGQGHDCNLFKGIFVRYFTILIQHPDISENYRTRFVAWLKNNANYLWTYGTEKSPDIKFSYHWWETPSSDIKWGDLRSALSAAMTIEAMALLEKEGFLD